MKSNLPNNKITRVLSNLLKEHFFQSVAILVLLILITGAIGHRLSSNLTGDEGVFAEMSRSLARGGLPYRDAWDHKPPVIYFILSLFIAVFGNTILAIRLAALSMCILFVLAVILLIKQLVADANSRAAMVVAGVLAVVYSAMFFSRNGAETTFFMTTFEACAFLVAVVARGRIKWLLFAGLLFAAGFFSKQPTLISLPILLMFAIWRTPNHHWRSGLAILAGFLLGVGIVVAWALINHIAPEFWYQAFQTNFFYALGANPSLAQHILSSSYFFQETIPVLGPLWVLSIPSAYLLWKNREPKGLVVLILLWVGLAFIGASIGTAQVITYFSQMLTPLTLLNALAVPYFLRLYVPVQRIIIMFVTLALVVINWQVFIGQGNEETASFQGDLQPITNYIQQHTQPTACVWSWGLMGSVLYLADRNSCTRQLQDMPVIISEAFDILRNRAEYMQSLLNNPPTLHILNSPWSYFPTLQVYADRYRKERVFNFGGYQIYRVDTSSWKSTFVNFDNQIALIGTDFFQDGNFCPGNKIDLALTWRVLRPIDHQYQSYVHVRSLDEATTYVQYDGLPAQNDRPTQTWQYPGEILLGDTISLPLPRDIPAGKYKLLTGFYDLDTRVGLPVLEQTNQPQKTYSILSEMTVKDNCLAGGK